MPYFISESNPDCSGWAVEKEDGEVIGCHTSKQAAIDQMVAVSIAEDMEPGGERAVVYEMEDSDEEDDESVGGGLPENYRPAASPDVPANRNCGNCEHFDKFWCRRWLADVSSAYYCDSWDDVHGLPNDNPGQTVQTGDVNDEDPQYQPYNNILDRQLSFDVPVYVREAARKGLDYYGQGLGGDGLVARTIREARDMAAGRISEDKVIRANAWGARHLVDLDAPQNSNADNDGFPGNGAVAFYLWGIDPLDPSPAMRWFERQAERVREEEGRLGYLVTLARLSRLFVDK